MENNYHFHKGSKSGGGAMKRKCGFVFCLAVLVLPVVLHAQWAQTYGGKQNDSGTCVQMTPDGGYIVAGMSESFSGTMKRAVLVLKLSAAGAVQWQNYYSLADYGGFIQNTRDGGFIVTGECTSQSDMSALKLDSEGMPRWFTYVWDRDTWYHSVEGGKAVDQMGDGGYIIAGWIYILPDYQPLIRLQSPRSLAAASGIPYIFKTDSLGNGKWDLSMTDGIGSANSIQATPDGGFIVAGNTTPRDGGRSDVVISKHGPDRGNQEWRCRLGGKETDEAHEIRRTSDGGYIVSGPTNSFGAGDYDIWILKLSGKGKIIWQKTYGGPRADYAHSIYPLADGGFVVAGSTASFGAGHFDSWILRLDARGAVIWEKTYGGTSYDGAFSVRPLKAGGFIVVGRTRSFGAGGDDVLVMKLTGKGAIDASCGSFIGTSNAIVKKSQCAVSSWGPGGGGQSSDEWMSPPVSTPSSSGASRSVICKR
jgi:hypothetical protein